MLDPAYEALAVAAARRAHPKFLQGAGTERPRIWGAMNADLEDPTDRAEGNLDGFWGFVSYDMLNSTSPDTTASVLKLEAEQVEKVVKATYMDFVSNNPQELGEALWLASSSRIECAWWAKTLKDRALGFLDTLWGQGYFTAEKKFRRAGPELWVCFGLSTTYGLSEDWKGRAAQLRATWKDDALSGKLSEEDQLAYCLATFPGTAWRGYRSDPTKDLLELSVRQLRLACKSKGLDYASCVEKRELVDLLLGKSK